ncbi:P22 phage major capsid protein family protein [Legionella maceachernii]|uniref:Putative phage capside protein (P22 coat protein) n=1 Tax=Legionella maceachernii TaxID=466 RepID=A0A0W0WBE5_9GAMM|nr:P22 phage major capsid protein family protein [Legionella maceachernii]KTD29675.1 putative phage capside protein (P22 coat protein) [Legionella maceachernii]SKA21021.1 P22 coat protein-gene protein 5 [Legionella maceachernii]SUP02598.1 P22 coat protein - gene protein 5 [Legionella maceachernii]
MAVPNNILQQVQTYQRSNLAYLQNLNCFVATANTKFKNFEKLTANLGDTVTFDLPPRFTTAASLVATFQSADQRVENLTVDKAINVSYAFTAQQFIFNVEDYMEQFGKSAVMEMSAEIESDIARVCVEAPYRFYGDGITPINSYGQLASALAMFRNYGAAKDNTKFYLSDIAQSAIVNTGLNQFVPRRNDEAAMSWDVGDFDRAAFYVSNLLPVHEAGTIGNDGTVLTVVSVVKDANDAVIQIVFSGAGTDANAIKAFDKGQFNDGVAGQPNLRYLTFIGHKPSSNPVQFRVLNNAASSAGNVTVDVYPPLKASQGNTRNLNYEIAAGMQVTFLPDHRAGVITSGNPLFLGMPMLPEEVPFPTGNETDPDTGVSLRMYYGSLFGQNQRGMIHDAIWGKKLVPEYSMSVIFPL